MREIKDMLDFPHVCGLSGIIENMGELVWIWEQSRFVNPAPRCCSETTCIYICRGSRCFESSIHKTEQLIIPKYSRRATNDPSRTCCHRERAGMNKAAGELLKITISLYLCHSLYHSVYLYSCPCFTVRTIQTAWYKVAELSNVVMVYFYISPTCCVNALSERSVSAIEV